MIGIVRRKIKDDRVIWLLRTILKNHEAEISGKGMPIGNLTSQFLANVYLNELDNFVKHELKAKYYIRYVDDFVVLNKDKIMLEKWRMEIDSFLANELKLELHPEKTRIITGDRGITLLGFRIFLHHRLLKKSNVNRMWKRIYKLKRKVDRNEITPQEALRRLEGWLSYAKFADTYKLRNRVIGRYIQLFSVKTWWKSL